MHSYNRRPPSRQEVPMPKVYDRLVSEIQKLQRRAHKMQKVRARAIARVHALLVKFGIEPAELRRPRTQKAKPGRKDGRAKASKAVARRRAKAAPKYRGPGGVTWAGRGLTPVWLREAV